jgi:hypothetical protein
MQANSDLCPTQKPRRFALPPSSRGLAPYEAAELPRQLTGREKTALAFSTMSFLRELRISDGLGKVNFSPTLDNVLTLRSRLFS